MLGLHHHQLSYSPAAQAQAHQLELKQLKQLNSNHNNNNNNSSSNKGRPLAKLAGLADIGRSDSGEIRPNKPSGGPTTAISTAGKTQQQLGSIVTDAGHLGDRCQHQRVDNSIGGGQQRHQRRPRPQFVQVAASEAKPIVSSVPKCRNRKSRTHPSDDYSIQGGGVLLAPNHQALEHNKPLVLNSLIRDQQQQQQDYPSAMPQQMIASQSRQQQQQHHQDQVLLLVQDGPSSAGPSCVPVIGRRLPNKSAGDLHHLLSSTGQLAPTNSQPTEAGRGQQVMGRRSHRLMQQPSRGEQPPASAINMPFASREMSSSLLMTATTPLEVKPSSSHPSSKKTSYKQDMARYLQQQQLALHQNQYQLQQQQQQQSLSQSSTGAKLILRYVNSTGEPKRRSAGSRRPMASSCLSLSCHQQQLSEPHAPGDGPGEPFVECQDPGCFYCCPDTTELAGDDFLGPSSGCQLPCCQPRQVQQARLARKRHQQQQQQLSKSMRNLNITNPTRQQARHLVPGLRQAADSGHLHSLCQANGSPLDQHQQQQQFHPIGPPPVPSKPQTRSYLNLISLAAEHHHHHHHHHHQQQQQPHRRRRASTSASSLNVVGPTGRLRRQDQLGPLNSSGRRDRQADDGQPTTVVGQMYESLASELKAKLSDPKAAPILLPPRDYDTISRRQGKLTGIESRRSTNPQLVGPTPSAIQAPSLNPSKSKSTTSIADDHEQRRQQQQQQHDGLNQVASAATSARSSGRSSFEGDHGAFVIDHCKHRQATTARLMNIDEPIIMSAMMQRSRSNSSSGLGSISLGISSPTATNTHSSPISSRTSNSSPIDLVNDSKSNSSEDMACHQGHQASSSAAGYQRHLKNLTRLTGSQSSGEYSSSSDSGHSIATSDSNPDLNGADSAGKQQPEQGHQLHRGKGIENHNPSTVSDGILWNGRVEIPLKVNSQRDGHTYLATKQIIY